MKIVMLGHSNAGKTTYVSLMYETMSAGVEGFTVLAESAEDHRRLLAAAKAVRAGRYPDPSDQRHDYRLRLHHGDSPLISFTWRDYRGGALLDTSASPQAKEFRADLAAADGIVIFVDAPELASNTRARRKVRSLVFNLMTAIEDRPQTTPIVLAMTKCDLFSQEPVWEVLLEPFVPLLQAVADTRHIHATLVDLACGPQPINIPYPVLFCLFFGIRARAEVLSERLNGHFEARNRALTENTLPKRFEKWWNNQPAPLQVALAHQAKAYAEWQQLEPLLAPADHLLMRIKELPTF
jgi:signal recognition particle receptor subunit beta